MIDELDEIVVWLKKLKRPAASSLKAPLSPGQFEARCKKGGVPMVQELAEIYAWHDGTEMHGGRTLDELHLFPDFYFCSSDEAISEREVRRDDWDPFDFPIFANGGGDFLLRTADGSIRHFKFDEPDEPNIAYRSLESMLRVMLRCYEQRVFYVDDGYLEIDRPRRAAIARDLEPGLVYWGSR